jgi:hypothetical protein
MCKKIRNECANPDVKRIVDHFLERIKTLELTLESHKVQKPSFSQPENPSYETLLDENEKLKKMNQEILNSYVDKKVEPLIQEIRRLNKDRERIEKIVKRPLKIGEDFMKIINKE